MAEAFDIAVVGGGIAGISAAYHLARHRSVVVLERESALGYHATGRSAAEFAFRFHTPLVGRLAAASYPFLTAPPAGFSEVALLRRRGNLIVADREKVDLLAKMYATEGEGMPGVERLTVEQAVARAPILRPDWVADAFFDPDCWDIEAESLLQGYAKGARAAGASIRTGVEVKAARREGSAWVLETSKDEVRAAVVVNAAGAWADATAAMFGLAPLGIVPYRRTAITVDAPGVDVGALPEISDVGDTFYMKPDAGRLMVSPCDATESPPCDAQPEELDVAYAAWYVEQATTIPMRAVAHRWAGLRTFAPDKAPVVGFSAGAQGFFWLAGQGGFGIQTAPALGSLAAGLIVDGKAPESFAEHGLTAAPFAPARLGG